LGDVDGFDAGHAVEQEDHDPEYLESQDDRLAVGDRPSPDSLEHSDPFYNF
jgi:hypothetical protein